MTLRTDYEATLALEIIVENAGTQHIKLPGLILSLYPGINVELFPFVAVELEGTMSFRWF